MPGLSRKTVTILFSDVVDSTPLGEALDPEQLRFVMTGYFAQMRLVIEKHGGSVEKYVGDAVMAVFGIPQVHEDDPLRAVRAAQEMQEALRTLNRELDEPLAIRTGLATGEVVTGDDEIAVFGDTANVAARLEQYAAPGEVLISDATRALVRDAVVAEPLGGLVLKGKREPVVAWRVTAVKPHVPGRLRRFDTELVGRDGELALLRQAQARGLVTRTCHLFTIVGAAGVGKSRLAHEIVRELASEAKVAVGRCLPYGDGITFWPLREIAHTIGDVRRYVGEADALVVDTAAGTADTRAEPEDIERAFRRLFEAVARERPLIVVIEDIQWAAWAMLDLIEHVAASARDAPILLLCLARPELLDERSSWGGGKLNATTILLEPLAAEDADRLVANLAGDGLAAEARRSITEAAEGNPLFLEEMVAMVLDEGAPVVLPATINALLTARLDALPTEHRETLAVAAVVGRFFSAEAVSALAGEDARASLTWLEEHDLIRAQPAPYAQESAYRIRHMLIRDAAYEGLAKAQRAELHERLADWLEATGEQREVDERVGWHLEHACAAKRDLGTRDDRLARRGYDALARAARRTLAHGDAAGACSLLDRALGLHVELGRDRIEASLDLVTALLERGDLARAERLIEEALDDARLLGDDALLARAEVERSHMQIHTDPVNWIRTVRTAATAAQETLAKAGDVNGLARASLLLVVHDYIKGRPGDLDQALEPALLHARLSDDPRHLHALLALAARSVLWAPLPVGAAIDRCAALLEEGADAAVVYGVRACLRAMAADFDGARLEYAAAQALLEEFGRTRQQAVHRFYSGSVELWAGDGAAAERELRGALDIIETVGDRGTYATAAALLAAALQLQGRDEEGRRFAEAGRRDASPADIVAQVLWRTALARLVPQRGLRLAEQAVAVASATDWIVLEADATLCLRDVLLSHGRDDEAAGAGERAAILYRAKGHTAGLHWVANPRRLAMAPSKRRTVAGGT